MRFSLSHIPSSPSHPCFFISPPSLLAPLSPIPLSPPIVAEALAESHARVTAAQAERDEVRRRCDREQAALAARLSQAFRRGQRGWRPISAICLSCHLPVLTPDPHPPPPFRSILVSFKEHVEEQLGALHAQVQRAAADVAAAPLPS